MATTWFWKGASLASWANAANWETDPPGGTGYPVQDQTVVIAGGMPILAAHGGAEAVVNDLAITLGGGGNTGEPVGLHLVKATLDRTSLTIASGADGQGTPVEALIEVIGTTTLQGRIAVEAQRGGLTIALHDSGQGEPGVLHLADDPAIGSGGDSLLAVAQQSRLTLRGGTVQNDGFIQVEGVTRLAASAAITGAGRIEVENGGTLRLMGSVEAGSATAKPALALPDGLGHVVIGAGGGFDGTLQFGTTAGAWIDLRGLHASAVDVTGDTLRLLGAGGETLASFGVALINPNTLELLPQAQQTLDSAEFTLRDLGAGGTRLLYTPHGATILQSSLPVPLVAEPGSLMELGDILAAAFGTATPDFPLLTLLPTTPDGSDVGYWGQPATGGVAHPPAWLVNGEAITGVTVVQPTDHVQLRVGNNINDPPQMMAQLSPDALHPGSVFMTYNIWTVAPKAAMTPLPTGQPMPEDVVAAAYTHASVYAGAVNTELCNWIADNIAAAAGATMPFPNASLSTEQNQEGGFWRIAYSGSTSPAPYLDWSSLVLPGDIVRMQWTTQAGHTTTVAGAYDPDTGKIMVYDNIGPAAPPDNHPPGNTTAVHPASYWNGTTPEGITIYRLDPAHQYLTTGTRQGEFIQGTVFDDLIRPGGGGDTIALGPGADEIEGRARDLRGAVLRGFDDADAVHLTDLDPATATVRLRGETLIVFDDGHRVAAFEIDGIAPGSTFDVTADPHGGALIALHSVIA